MLSIREPYSCKPDFAMVFFNLGVILEQKGGYKEAMAACEDALRINPSNVVGVAAKKNLQRLREKHIYTGIQTPTPAPQPLQRSSIAPKSKPAPALKPMPKRQNNLEDEL